MYKMIRINKTIFIFIILLIIHTPTVFGYTIRSEHPRLYINSTNIDEIRTRAANENASMYSDIMNSNYRFGVEAKYNEDISSWSRENRMAYVLRSAFVYTVGEIPGYNYAHTMAEYGEKGKEALLYWAHHDNHGEMDLPNAVVGYDHFYYLLTPAERKVVVDALIEAAESCITEGGKTYTRFGSKAPGLSRWTMVGLGFAGDGANIGDGSQATYYNDKATEYNNDYDTYFKNGTMQAHNWLQGMWFSPDYSNYCTRLVWIMEAWNTATTDTNTYNDFQDWYKGIPEFFLHSMAPYNRDMLRRGDVRYAHTGFDDAGTLQEALGVVLVAVRYRADINGDSETASLANWLIVSNNMHNYSSTWFFLWDAPDADHDDPATLGLPTTHIFSNGGLFTDRTDWTDPDATYLAFYSHPYFLSNHDHADAGSFTIYKRDPLAIKSGAYSSGDKRNHERNYQYRTISENNILIYDPAEIWHWSGAIGGGVNASNDGGQKWFNNPPFDVSDLTPGSMWDAGGLDKVYTSDNLNYIFTDTTAAYTSKAQSIQRELVHLRDKDYIIVFDRLTKDTEKPSVYLLHSKTVPTVNSNIIKIASDGGHLSCNIVFPLSPVVSTLGGVGSRFEDLEGNNYPVDPDLAGGWNAEYGDYRTEVRQPSNATNEYYLTLLHPGLTDTNITTTAISGQNWLGVYAPDSSSGRVIIFSKTSNFAESDTIDYTITINNEAKHYIADLTAGSNYDVTATNNGSDVHITITKDSGGQYIANSQGLIGFSSHYNNEGNNIQLEQISLNDNSSSSSFRADVDNNSQINTTDAMLTLRNSLGLSMTNTNWQASSTTGDVNCDGTSNSTDAMLILRYSLGLSMSGTGWCVN